MILFPLEQPPLAARLVYRPWGTRTIKVQVTTARRLPALRLRPKGQRPFEQQAGLFCGYADDSDAFQVSWGGGHEAGPCLQAEDVLLAFEKCVPLEPGQSRTLYFNLTHVGPELPPTATVSLEAYDESSGDIVAMLPIQLVLPTAVPRSLTQFMVTEEGGWQPNGRFLPHYDSRWWPAADVTYLPAGPLPLQIGREANVLRVSWLGQTAVTITDHTQPTILDMNAVRLELFAFDEWHVALRIWFFWLDKTIGHGFFVGRHEVPDAERFDLLLRRADGRVTLACTDLHWREVWGLAQPQRPLTATLGLSREVKRKLAQEQMAKLWDLWDKTGVPDHAGVYNPLPYIQRTAVRLGRDPASSDRARGTEAHLPMLHNVNQITAPNQPPRMTSSDVRQG